MHIDHLPFLRLLQLADSAVPIGSTAHSFGLETLVAEDYLNVETLEPLLRDYLHEAGTLESAFCRLAHRLASSVDHASFETDWPALNAQLSALKTARESRIASATLGRRFLQLALALEGIPLLQRAIQAAKTAETDIHYSPAFGLVSSLLGVDETASALAHLQQSLAALVSACQRLMPLGQNRASSILWRLKPALIEVACRSDVTLPLEATAVFTPLPDLGSMRHPGLATRLFIS